MLVVCTGLSLGSLSSWSERSWQAVGESISFLAH